ncbi:MAG: hypothetical protein JWR50_3728 [Mucilaginibacter sp.]|nr:hypothetical protein [Mucilaginibacter sp.]
MKKTLLTLIILIGVTLSSFSQKTEGGKFSIGVDAGLPVGDLRSIATFTIGGSLKYEHPICDKLWATVSGGYTYIPYKNDILIANLGYVKTNSGEGFIPLKAGLKYFFNDVIYGEGQVGAAIATQSGGNTKFVYAPGVGIIFDKNIDIGIRYEAWAQSGGTLSQFALRLAYCF